jgi:hypothetical protein
MAMCRAFYGKNCVARSTMVNGCSESLFVVAVRRRLSVHVHIVNRVVGPLGV